MCQDLHHPNHIVAVVRSVVQSVARRGSVLENRRHAQNRTHSPPVADEIVAPSLSLLRVPIAADFRRVVVVSGASALEAVLQRRPLLVALLCSGSKNVWLFFFVFVGWRRCVGPTAASCSGC